MRPPKYTQLQPAILRVKLGADWQHLFYLLRFPEAWKDSLLAIAGSRRSNGEAASIPISLLNDTLIALVPDIITVASKAAIGERPPWLYSQTAVDRTSLFALIAAWVRCQPGDRRLIEAALTKMQPTDLEWEPATLDFAAMIRKFSTPADVTGDEVFRLLPHVLATRLSARTAECSHYAPPGPDGRRQVARTSRFLRCPTENGAQVMSWAPHDQPDAPFSFFLNLTVQTRAFSAEPVVHVGIGTRRWTHKPAMLSHDRAHTVYLLPSVPYVPGIEHTRSFMSAMIEPLALRNGRETRWSAKWKGQLGQILAELGCLDRLPDPGQLRDEPTRWLGKHTDAAGLVFRNGMYPFAHPVSPGTALADKVPLLDWTAETLAPCVALHQPLTRSSRTILPLSSRVPGTAAGSADTAGTRDMHVSAARLRAATRDVVGPVLGIDILYDTQLTLDYARQTLTGLLGVDIPESIPQNKPALLDTPELTIALTIGPVAALAADLTPDPAIPDRQDRLRSSVEERAAQIAAAIDPVAYPAIALIEIAGKDRYKGKRRPLDPKFAVKVGMGRAGRLTQFLHAAQPRPLQAEDAETPKSDPNKEILLSSWADLFRQLGVRAVPVPPPLEGSGIDTAPACLAFWIIRQNRQRYWGATRQIPVAVLIDPTGTNIRVCAPDVPWSALHQAQLALSRRHMLSDQKRGAGEITRFFERVLREAVGTYPDILLLTHAQNLRGGWGYVNNAALAADRIAFGANPQPITRYPGLRHVRLRTSDRNEAPEGYAINDSEQSHYPGLWPMDGDRVYLSTASKPASARRAARYASKVTPYVNIRKTVKDADPRAMVWNSRPVEITVAAVAPGRDDPEAWATLAHQLRWTASHHDDPLTLAWPLHVAKQLGEYVLPVELLEEIADQDNSDANEETSER
jgi:hypothetical protein